VLKEKNVLFRISFINNEKYETYQWLLKQFLEKHKTTSKLFVTDGDPAICKAVSDYASKSDHFVCQWHLKRNFQRHFSYLKKNNLEEYDDMVLKLSDLTDKKQFENYFSTLESFFNTNESYKKSLNYLKDLISYKEKWDNCHRKLMFTAGEN